MSSSGKKPKAQRAPLSSPGGATDVGVPGSTTKAPPASLRLAIGRSGIAIELDDDVAFGPVRLVDLSIRLPGLPFPLDVSGGVDRFRHRRGQLARIELDVDGDRVSPHLGRAFRGILSAETPDVWVAVERWGARIAVRSRALPLARGPRSVLAFDLVVDPFERGVRLHVARARGLDLPAPARHLALRALGAATHRLGRRDAGRFVLETIPELVTEALLPDLGVRMPAIEPLHFAWFATAHRAGSLIASRDAGPELDAHVLAARELHDVIARADDALFVEDFVRARTELLRALEVSPHEPSLLHALADLDRHAGSRAEAALSTLARSPRAARPIDGGLAGALHEETGDLSAALATFTITAEREDVSWLGAACFAKAASLCEQPFDALEWLERAIVRDPTDAALHGARVRVAFAAGRPSEARASVEHLDAMLVTAEEKYGVWVAAGKSASERGFGSEAIALFERALARVPDEPLALAGLGVTMLQERRIARGVAMLHRALERAEETGAPTAPIALSLAKALAEGLDNLPGAIARVRRIPNSSEEALEARLLEGRWRAALGDILGASVAFAHFRELARVRVVPDSRIRGDLVAAGLLEAARFERHQHHDILASHAHASIGLELRPTDQALRALYRHVAAELAFPGGSAPAAGTGTADERAAPRAHGSRATSPDHEPLAERLEPESSRPAAVTLAPTMPPAGFVEDLEPLASRLEPLAPLEDATPPSDAPFTPLAPGIDAMAHLESLGHALDMSLEEDAPGDAALEQRAADLMQRLQLDPSDDRVADELVEVLTTLGRGHELLALLLARLEDAPEERKPALRARTRDVLGELAKGAESSGRNDEASLFRMTADALG